LSLDKTQLHNSFFSVQNILGIPLSFLKYKHSYRGYLKGLCKSIPENLHYPSWSLKDGRSDNKELKYPLKMNHRYLHWDHYIPLPQDLFSQLSMGWTYLYMRFATT